MTRHLSSTRRTITRAVERDRYRPRASTPVEDGITVVHAVIDKLGDAITEECMTAVSVHLHSLGLSGDLGDARDLRAATREYVLGCVMDTLQERIDHHETLTDVLAQLRVSKTREMVERILIGYSR